MCATRVQENKSLVRDNLPTHMQTLTKENNDICKRWLAYLPIVQVRDKIKVRDEWLTSQCVVCVAEDIRVCEWRFAERLAQRAWEDKSMYEAYSIARPTCQAQDAFRQQKNGWVPLGSKDIRPNYMGRIIINCEYYGAYFWLGKQIIYSFNLNKNFDDCCLCQKLFFPIL